MEDLCPVVLRFKEMFPTALARMQMHARRSGGDLDHVTLEHSGRNRIYEGSDPATSVRAEIRAMSVHNLNAEIAALCARKRKKDADRRRVEGLTPPWKAATNGPLREAILTARWDYFAADTDTPDSDVLITHGRDDAGATVERRLSRAKIAAFESAGRAFFDTYFPGQVRHLRLDLDEESPHFHAVIMTTVEKTSARRGTQKLIQPSANVLLKNYEHAQDVAGLHFAQIGLTRGEERAAARRAARAADRPVPEVRGHISPREFRDRRAGQIMAQENRATKAADEAKRALSTATLEQTLARQALEAATSNRAQTAIALDRARSAETSVAAKTQAVERGTRAVMDEELVYRPPGAEKPEGLNIGPKGPREKSAIEALRKVVMPAYDFVLSLAKCVAHLRNRERAAERRAAELARRASVLSATARRFGLETRVIDDIAIDTVPARLTAEDFPEALAVSDRDDPSSLQARLDAMSNRTLYATARATADARLLCDDAPALRSQFSRGAAVLNLSAAQRGLDLETGRHDPKRATDSGRARLHTDSIETAIKRRPPTPTRDRQRVRG